MCDHLLTNRHGDLLVCATCGRSRVLPSVERAFFQRIKGSRMPGGVAVLQPAPNAPGHERTNSADSQPTRVEVPR